MAGEGKRGGRNLFGDFVKNHRKKLKLTLRNFCLKVGIDPGNFSKIRSSRRIQRKRTPTASTTVPRKEKIKILAAFLPFTPSSEGDGGAERNCRAWHMAFGNGSIASGDG